MPSSLDGTGSAKTINASQFGLIGAITGMASLAVTGAIVGSSFSGNTGANTIVNAPTGKDIVYQLAGTEYERITSIACTATGGNVKIGGGAKYNTCAIASPLTTTGALKQISLQCGNVAKALQGDISFAKTAVGGTGSALVNGSNVIMGTGAYIYTLSGVTLWNPADTLKFGTTVSPTGALNATRYDCTMRAVVEDIYGR